MLQNASYMFFFYKKRNKTKQNDYEKKEKSLNVQEWNPRHWTSRESTFIKSNALCIAPGNQIAKTIS